jgi:hypothetical protein
MPIRRTSRLNQKKWLRSNKDLKILDLGCSNNNYWPEANHYADIWEFEETFKEKKLNFTRIQPDQKLPFKDKEFDYVICAHVIEHVNDPVMFKSEIERIGKAGYIELPTRLNDNMVFGCDEEEFGHKWWFEFDDDNKKLVFAKRINAIEKFVSVGSIFALTEIFQDSFIIQAHWTNEISLEKRAPYEVKKKIGFLTIIKKYFSKKIREKISKVRKLFN